MDRMNGAAEGKMTVDQKLELLRAKMRERGMDAYMVPTADFHESEYVGDHFKCRQYLTGFTGSAGIAVVTMKEACLWVDGRYFVQAAAQLQGTSVKMMKMGQESVPSVAGYLEAEVPENGCLGFDGRVVNALTGIDLEKRLKEKMQRSFAAMIWWARSGKTVRCFLQNLHGHYMRNMQERQLRKN